MAGSFQVNYNAGGVVDEVKNLKQVDNINNLDNVANIEVVGSIGKLDEIGHIVGFPTKTQPYNTMKQFDIAASKLDPATLADWTFDVTLPVIDIEILAITLTCSGYGEGDHYDLFVNGVKWFDNWYCSEVREGLFLGTSTFVYAAPANSNIKLVFKNDSGTAKTVWLGIRMLVN